MQAQRPLVELEGSIMLAGLLMEFTERRQYFWSLRRSLTAAIAGLGRLVEPHALAGDHRLSQIGASKCCVENSNVSLRGDKSLQDLDGCVYQCLAVVSLEVGQGLEIAL